MSLVTRLATARRKMVTSVAAPELPSLGRAAVVR